MILAAEPKTAAFEPGLLQHAGFFFVRHATIVIDPCKLSNVTLEILGKIVSHLQKRQQLSHGE